LKGGAVDNIVTQILDQPSTQFVLKIEMDKLMEQQQQKFEKQLKELEANIVGKQLDYEMLKADNNHLVIDLKEKDNLMQEWVVTAHSWQEKMKNLEEENEKLREVLQRASHK